MNGSSFKSNPHHLKHVGASVHFSPTQISFTLLIQVKAIMLALQEVPQATLGMLQLAAAAICTCRQPLN